MYIFISFDIKKESEQRASLRILESVSQERDLVRKETHSLRDTYHRSEKGAQVPTDDVEDVTHPLDEDRNTCEFSRHS